MKRIFFGLCASLLLATPVLSHAFQPDDIIGYWRTIDDETGFAKAIVQIKKAKDGTYIGTIVETIPRPDYTPIEFCQNCPAPFTNKRLMEIPLVWNLKIDPRRTLSYTNGYLLDLTSGKLYAIDVRLSADDRRLMIRAKVIGVGFLNRIQMWMREPNYKPK